ncbi:MAG: helix-hairpin-helix domain-containing protein [Pirellulales bacterium]
MSTDAATTIAAAGTAEVDAASGWPGPTTAPFMAEQCAPEALERAERCARAVAIHLARNEFEAAHAAVFRARLEYNASLAPVDRRRLELAESGLDPRTVNALERHGIFTIEQLAGLTRAEILAIPNFGETTWSRIQMVLESLGCYIPPPQTGAMGDGQGVREPVQPEPPTPQRLARENELAERIAELLATIGPCTTATVCAALACNSLDVKAVCLRRRERFAWNPRRGGWALRRTGLQQERHETQENGTA